MRDWEERFAPVCQLGKLPNQQQWLGLKSVGMVVCERLLWNKTTIEVRFYISSLEHDALVLAHAVRSHWGIENSVHWSLHVVGSAPRRTRGDFLKSCRVLQQLDVTFNEDALSYS